MLSDCYLPRLGGIEVQVHDLAAGLRARGHEVEVFTATAGPRGERGGFVDRVDGVPVHRLALRLPFELPVNPLAAPALLRRLLAGGFDVAHVHTGVVSPFAVDCARVSTGAHLPTTMTWHCMVGRLEPAFHAAGYVRAWARRGVAMNAVSAVAAAPLQRVVGDAGTVEVLPNGIDVATWVPPAPPPPRQPGDAVRVVSAMRLATRKRPLPLLRVMRQVRRLVADDLPIRLQILGDGPERARLRRYAAAHAMTGWVGLPGRVSREEVQATYAAADVYVAPARLESFGIAALEARTAGLPVVGRRGSGVGEFVRHGEGGFLADGDGGMARYLARLVGDEELRAGMTAHNLRVPPVQAWPHVLDRAEREYARAIRLAGSRR